MLRTPALLACASAASAQGIVSPYVPPVIPPVPPPPYFGLGGFRPGGFTTTALPYYGPAYGVLPYVPYYGYNPVYGVPYYPLTTPAPAVAVPLPNLAPPDAVSKDIAGSEFTARLELVFPAPADVWESGVQLTGSPTADVTLTSPPLKVGAAYTFRVRATWQVQGAKHQVERSVAVKAGERSRLTIVSGDPVR